MSVLRELMLKILLKKEVDVMAVVYATLIIKGRKTIDQVPAIIRDRGGVRREPRPILFERA